MNPMQGPWSTVDPSSEVIHSDEEHISSANSEAPLNNLLNPVDGRFSNYSIPSGGSAYMSSRDHDVQGHNWWSSGESSSRLGPDQVNGITLKMDHQLSSDGFHPLAGYRSEEGQLGSTGVMFPGGVQIGHSSNHVRNRSPFLQGSNSNHMSQTVNLSMDLDNNVNAGQSSGIVIHHNHGGSSFASSSRAGEESSSGSGSSLGGWGSSCKRKALEGASGHCFPGGSQACFVQAENSAWHTGSTQYDASSSLSLSTPSQDPPVVIGQSRQPEPRLGMGGGRAASVNAFTSARNMDTSSRHLGRRLNPGQQQDLAPFSLSSSENSVRFSVSSQHHLPVTSPFVDPLDVRSTTAITGNTSAAEREPNIIHLPALTRNIHQFARNGGASSSRTRNSSSIMMPGERFGPPWDIPRSNSEHPMFAPATEMRVPAQDQSIWAFNRGNPSGSGDASFIPHAGPSSGIHSLQPNPAWIPAQNTSMHNPPRISELAPWSLFPSIESESVGHSGSFPLLPAGPSVSSIEAAMPSGSSSRSHRPRPRRLGLLSERQNDLLHMRHLGRSLAAENDGRTRLVSEIRQVLNAVRRGENLRFEDYVVFDSLIHHGMAEMHDRHRDMRLDVDNMSYEELLALEERIGDVSTGLSEEVILKVMKQQKYEPSEAGPLQEVEPCCICQEEYTEGEDLGTLDCGHEFHTECIKQWVMLKNLCPICKTTALST